MTKTFTRQIIQILFLIMPLFSSGCFSAFSRSDLGGGKQTVGAAALDVVTFPVQAVVIPPAYVIMKSDEAAQERKAKEEHKHLMTSLENDPMIAMNERWDLKKNEYHQVFIDSFSNPNVKYSSDSLEKIYEMCPSMQDFVFRSLYCSKEFLTKCFNEAFEKSRNGRSYYSQIRIGHIIENKNTPIELVEKVAFATNYPNEVTAEAKFVLKQRQSEIQTH